MNEKNKKNPKQQQLNQDEDSKIVKIETRLDEQQSQIYEMTQTIKAFQNVGVKSSDFKIQQSKMQLLEDQLKKLLQWKEDQIYLTEQLKDRMNILEVFEGKIVLQQKNLQTIEQQIDTLGIQSANQFKILDKLTSDLETELNDINQRFLIINYIQGQLGDIRLEKASHENLKELKEYVEETFMKIKQFEFFKQEQVEIQMKNQLEFQTIDTNAKNLQNQVDDFYQKYLGSNKNLEKFKNETNQKIQDSKLCIQKLQECSGENQSFIQEIFVNLSNLEQKKENKNVVSQIIKRLDDFTSIEHISKLQNVLLPKVEGFSKTLYDFMEKLKQMEIAIRVFEETICIKASKAQLLELSEEAEMKFVQVESWHKIQVDIEIMKDELQRDKDHLFQMFTQFKKDQYDKFDESCGEVIENRFEKYEKVMKSFSKFFHQDELSKQFERKADLSLINELNLNKVEKTELVYFKSQIESLNERLKDVSIIQSEITKALIPFQSQIKDFDFQSKNNFIQRAQNIQLQQKLVNKVIQKNELGDFTRLHYKPKERNCLSPKIIISEYEKSQKQIKPINTQRDPSTLKSANKNRNHQILNKYNLLIQSDKIQNSQTMNTNNQDLSPIEDIEYNQSLYHSPIYLQRSNQNKDNNSQVTRQERNTKMTDERSTTIIEQEAQSNFLMPPQKKFHVRIHPRTAIRRAKINYTQQQTDTIKDNFISNKFTDQQVSSFKQSELQQKTIPSSPSNQ